MIKQMHADKNIISLVKVMMNKYKMFFGLATRPMHSVLDRIIKSDTNFNFTKKPFKSIKIHVKPYILLVFRIIVACLCFMSTLIFNKIKSVTLYVGVRQDCPVRFTVHGCSSHTRTGSSESHVSMPWI